MFRVHEVMRRGPSRDRAFTLARSVGEPPIHARTGFRCPSRGATFNANGAWTGGERTSGLVEFTVTSNTTAGTITITS